MKIWPFIEPFVGCSHEPKHTFRQPPFLLSCVRTESMALTNSHTFPRISSLTPLTIPIWLVTNWTCFYLAIRGLFFSQIFKAETPFCLPIFGKQTKWIYRIPNFFSFSLKLWVFPLSFEIFLKDFLNFAFKWFFLNGSFAFLYIYHFRLFARL